MTITDIRALYDRHERREAELPGFRRVQGKATVRQLDLEGRHSCVIWADLRGRDMAAVIAGEKAYFAGLGQGFEWKTFSHDGCPELPDALGRAGFTVGESESIMVLELADAPELPSAVPGVELRRLEDPDRLSDLVAVHRAVWDEDADEYAAYIAAQMRAAPDCLSLYCAYADGEPVSVSRVCFPKGSPFASLWGGSTLEAWRGKGIYTAMLGIRIGEARRRGYSFMTIDAGPMSRPIVERRGFRLLSESRPCELEPA